MKRGAVAVVAVIILSLLNPAFSASPPKAGQKCSSVNKKQIYKNYQYTCIKKSGKLVWSKGVPVNREIDGSVKPTPSPTPSVSASSSSNPNATPSSTPTPSPSPTPTVDEANFVFKDICEKDPFIPRQWSGMEEAINASGHECSWPYRILKKNLTSEKPRSTLFENVQEISTCKLPDNPKKNAMVGWPTEFLDFWLKNMRHPSANSTIQLVPIYSKDAPDNGRNPLEDYKPYIDFLSDWIEHATDGKGKLVVRSPNRYLEFPDYIRDYKLTHERPESVAANFRSALEKYIVPQVNFSGASTGLIVLPAGSDVSLTQQVGLGQSRVGNDFVRWSIHPPFTLKETINSGSNFLHPVWWLHELHHATAGFDDTDKTSDRGLHMWGLMSYGANEMLGWQKWLMGLWGDERVFCADTQKGGTYWLAPSTFQSDQRKLVALRVSNSQVILIESMRAAGLNYKMPKWMEGVLVYGVENTTIEQHTGTFILKPENRQLLSPSLSGMIRKFVNSDAALKSGESTRIEGYKITVIESGTFGDVVRVEKS